jgi:exopolysaccharide production protein ExoZ
VSGVNAAPDSRNDAIQGLRGLAALLVVIAHAILALTETSTDATTQRDLAYLLGETGVRVFFVISGFIMTLTMFGQFGAKGAAAGFLHRRLVRVVPLYWLATAIYATKLALTDGGVSVADLALSLGFIPYVNEGGWVRPIYGLGWTLNYEMFFYALFALALLFRRSIALTVLLLLLAALGGTGFTEAGEDCSTWACGLVRFYTNPIILFFAFGIVLGLLRTAVDRRGVAWGFSPLAAVSLASGFTVLLALSGGLGFAWEAVACVAATAACAFARGTRRDGLFYRGMLATGDASYSIYLTHSFFIGPAATIWLKIIGPQGLPAFVLLTLCGAIILGSLSFRYVEKPALRLLRPRAPDLPRQMA